MSVRAKPPFRADHVGSFLRPAELLAARKRFHNREISKAELRTVEDRAIAEVVRMQEDAGIQGVTDGEFRRTYFHIDFLEQLKIGRHTSELQSRRDLVCRLLLEKKKKKKKFGLKVKKKIATKQNQ